MILARVEVVQLHVVTNYSIKKSKEKKKIYFLTGLYIFNTLIRFVSFSCISFRSVLIAFRFVPLRFDFVSVFRTTPLRTTWCDLFTVQHQGGTNNQINILRIKTSYWSRGQPTQQLIKGIQKLPLNKEMVVGINVIFNS